VRAFRERHGGKRLAVVCVKEAVRGNGRVACVENGTLYPEAVASAFGGRRDLSPGHSTRD